MADTAIRLALLTCFDQEEAGTAILRKASLCRSSRRGFHAPPPHRLKVPASTPSPFYRLTNRQPKRPPLRREPPWQRQGLGKRVVTQKLEDNRGRTAQWARASPIPRGDTHPFSPQPSVQGGQTTPRQGTVLSAYRAFGVIRSLPNAIIASYRTLWH